MSLPRYPEYKDSGVEWVGLVPVHWEVDRLKASITSCKNGIWGEEPKGDESDIECVRVADFDRARLVVDGVVPTRRSVTQSERAGRTLCRGDLLLEKSGGGERQPVGQVVLYDRDEPAVCSNFVAKVTLAEGMDPRFWMYQHAAAYARGINMVAIKQTSGIQNLDQSQYFDERGVFPPHAEQVQIAAFLDRETAKIDALIAEQEKLLALLAEKRQATISHAVTRGLDPNAPMKDSGIAWLGEVPAHWPVVRLKNAVPHVTVGIVVEPSRHYVDEGVPALRSLNVSGGEILMENLVYISQASNEKLSKSKLHAGDLVVVRSGKAGAAAVVPPELDGCNCIDLIIIRKPLSGSEQFLNWYLASDAALRQFEGDSEGAIQKHYNIGTAANLTLPWPSLEEQVEIAQYLDGQVRAIGKIQELTESSLNLLKERRSALISAAVTGQIDVRGFVEVQAV